jgi:CheY-like chemotaxis protein
VAGFSSAQGEQLVFTVTDTGIGIAQPKISQVFEAFQQADGSVTRQYGGTGLGLSITRELAHLMGGSVEAQSASGRGSTFSLTLPLLRVEALGAVSPMAAAPSAQRLQIASAAGTLAPVDDVHPPLHLGKQVLLAEDNEVNVYLFKAMLEGQGLEIDVATNGLTALDLAQSRRYSLIFMDVQMPGMDGLSVTRELRRFELESGRARMPIIALTANAYDADVESSLAAGCDLHIAKPFTKPQLVEALFRFVPMA